MKLSFILLFILLAISGGAHAHGGGLDSYGCHHDRKHGGYHCHRGQFAGQSFTSQAEMLQAMQGATADSDKENTKKQK